MLFRSTAYDQEAVAQLILSGRYLGHLPAHYAADFESRGEVRALPLGDFSYTCPFYAICRRTPAATPLAALMLEKLALAHACGSAGGTLGT